MKRAIPIIVLLGFLLSGCETLVVSGPPRPPGPPPHAPAHGYYKKYVYHYYPELEIYWSVDLGAYVVFRGGQWVITKHRPIALTERHRYVVIEADDKEPWRHHADYKGKYPPGQAKFRGGPKAQRQR